MKYKLLLMGKNRIVIDDFFNVMTEEFDCITTSMRDGDVLNHIKFFQPNAIVYCINSADREDFSKFISILNDMRHEINIILLGNSELCNEFNQMKPDLVSLTILKPITASGIKQQIVKFLDEKKTLKEMQENEENDKHEEDEKNEDRLNIPVADELKHILVIDDDPIMLRLIKSELKDCYNVATAVSGKIGLTFLQRKKTDLILLDYEMPQENGVEILEKIRANEKLANIPVVFLTGIKDREKIMSVITMKPQGYLLKPIDHDNLIKTIQRLIG